MCYYVAMTAATHQALTLTYFMIAVYSDTVSFRLVLDGPMEVASMHMLL